MSEDWVSVLIDQQNLRSSLLGDSQNPLVDGAKKAQKQFRRKLVSEGTPTDITTILSRKETPLASSINTASTESSMSPNEPPQWITKSSEVKSKKKNKKKQKKKKKKGKKVLNTLSDSLLEADDKTGNLMAELIKNTDDFILVDDELWSYRETDGCFHLCSYAEVAKALHAALPYEEQLKISSRDYKESYEQLRISDDLVYDGGFFENGPYVNCINGVVDVLDGTLLEHSPDYFFKHCIHAEYNPNAKCPKFLEYADFITDGDKELKRLLRVMMGYIFSHYNNAKKAFLIYGIPHTGKSVLCNVIERILSKDYICHVDLCMLQKQEYAAALSGKLLNIAPDLKNQELKDVGFFKSLVSHDDKIAARALYSNPRDIKCETKMLFSSNHLLSFDSSLDVFDIEAVFNRLIYFPFQNKPISDSQDNKHLSDDILEERDGIFTWAMKGLKDYIENRECFPTAKLSNKIKAKNMAKYCPEKIFFEKYIKKEDGLYESSSALRNAFEEFCREYEVRTKGNIINFIEEHEKLSKSKKRIDENGFPTSSGNPIYVYEGIRLRKPYRK